MSKVHELITENLLRYLAGDGAYGRGLSYFNRNQVADLQVAESLAHAGVLGSREYSVCLRARKQSIEYECDCPVGDRGEFCKHAVAAALAVLSEARADGPGETAPAGGSEAHRLQAHLKRLDRQALEELLVQQADPDPALRRQLLMQAAMAGSAPDENALKQSVRSAFATGGFVDYYRMGNYVQRIVPVIETLDALLGTGRADVAAELCEYALHRGLRAYGQTDDSGGDLGDMLSQIAGLHLEACRLSEADGKKLAKTLFKLQIEDAWGLFEFENYVPLLGEIGLKSYRAFAGKAWEKVCARPTGETDGESEEGDWAITGIMETLARRDGDIDALVRIKCRDLSQVHNFLDIAQIYAESGQRKEAVEWAERGKQAFPERLNWPLIELLISLYRQENRHDDALKTAWEHFSANPSLQAYQLLKTCGEKQTAWPAWRDKALRRIRGQPGAEKRRRGHLDRPGGDGSLPVEIHLWEGDVQAALDEARRAGCNPWLWKKLAAACEKRSPAEAIEIYRDLVDYTVNLTNHDAYEEALEMVKRIRSLMRKTNTVADFGSYIDDLRGKFKAKRNFMKLLKTL